MQERVIQYVVHVDSLEIRSKVTISECHFNRQDSDSETMTEFKKVPACLQEVLGWLTRRSG